MAKGRESFDRRQRERAKKAKADAKRERRQARGDDEVEADDDEQAASAGPAVDQEAVMGALAKLHAAYDDGDVDFETFEEQRAELLSRLQVD